MPETHNLDEDLKALLSTYRVAPPDAALVGRILEGGQQRLTVRNRLTRWLVGAGLVGLGLAGGLTGAATVAIVLPSQSIIRTDYDTAFGSIQPDGDTSHMQEVQ
ncbi:hypothetical protein [Rhizobium sp. FKY42]|uniref:hypothetical protein n=1 Tax=Rhizobium sp. FKY42 TaxID=2562310 RepID=UPI0010BFAEB6|nr:hypothetical protein [Rhizobium sp. FKY42]